jgi:hypothetical protein
MLLNLLAKVVLSGILPLNPKAKAKEGLLVRKLRIVLKRVIPLSIIVWKNTAIALAEYVNGLPLLILRGSRIMDLTNLMILSNVCVFI